MSQMIEIKGVSPEIGLSTVTRAWLQSDMTKEFGKVLNVKKPPTTGDNSLDVAFVQFARQEDADKCVAALVAGVYVGNKCLITGGYKSQMDDRKENDRGRRWQGSWESNDDSRKIAQRLSSGKRSRSRSRRRRSLSRSRSRGRKSRSRSRGRRDDGRRDKDRDRDKDDGKREKGKDRKRSSSRGRDKDRDRDKERKRSRSAEKQDDGGRKEKRSKWDDSTPQPNAALVPAIPGAMLGGTLGAPVGFEEMKRRFASTAAASALPAVGLASALPPVIPGAPALLPGESVSSVPAPLASPALSLDQVLRMADVSKGNNAPMQGAAGWGRGGARWGGGSGFF